MRFYLHWCEKKLSPASSPTMPTDGTPGSATASISSSSSSREQTTGTLFWSYFSWRGIGLISILSNILFLAYLVIVPQLLAASSSNDNSSTTEEEPRTFIMERLTEFATSIHGVDIDAPEVGSPRGTTAEEEKDTTARALLEEEGFDPDDVRQADTYGRTPLLFFIAKENITMVQHLLVREADCRTTNTEGWCPLFMAAYYGHVEILQLLLQYDGTTREDIRKVTNDGISPLDIAFERGHFHVVQWLIMNGALAPHDAIDGSGIHDATLREAFGPSTGWREDKRRTVLSRARDKVASQEAVKSYLTTEATGPASSFAMTLQLMEQRLQTLRQLIRLLSAFIAEVPFVEEEEEEEDKHEEPNSVSRKGGADTTTNTNTSNHDNNKNKDQDDEDEKKRTQEEAAVRSSQREEQQKSTRGGDRRKTAVAPEVTPPKLSPQRTTPKRKDEDKHKEPSSVFRNGGPDTNANTNNHANNSNNTRSTSSLSSSSSIQELPEDDFNLDQDEEDEENRTQEEDAVRSSQREEQQKSTRGGDRRKTAVAQEVTPPNPSLRRTPTRIAKTTTAAILVDDRETTAMAQKMTPPKPPPRRTQPPGPRNSSRMVTANTTPPKVTAAATTVAATIKKTKKNISGNKRKRTRRHGDEDDDNDEDPNSENNDDSEYTTSDTPLTKRKKRVPNKYEARWNEMFNRLIGYKEQFKHTCVPKRYKADLVLAGWVQTQRFNYHNKHLTKEKIKHLEDLGFQWVSTTRKEKNNAKWVEVFNRLIEYKKQFKHTCVPKRYKADLVLAKWVQKQRFNYHNKCLTKERIEYLEDLGFQWVSTAMKDKEDAIWNERLEELKNYLEVHDGQLPKRRANSLCERKLAIWVNNQRNNPGSRAAHTEERKAKLRSISSGFHY